MFEAFLEGESESALRGAYELGRDAVARDIGLLELAQIHHDVLQAELVSVSETDACERMTQAAATFLLEALAAYEMLRRGFAEAREMVAIERQQAAMLRQLSTLLADTSLAFHAGSAGEEVLQLVAEQTRELTRAAWCVAQADALGRQTTTIARVGNPLQDPADVVRDAYAALNPARRSTAAVQTPPAGGEAVAASLAALDGQVVGVIAIGADTEHRFTELDHAILTHIAQMTAAALERAAHYSRPDR
jgi:GAF domain-containing protein